MRRCTPAGISFTRGGAARGGRPLLLDLYCGQGGCSRGYDLAGFAVVGIDHRAQPRYPYPFVQADALWALRRLLDGRTIGGIRLGDLAAIHASPPCQRWSLAGRQTRDPLVHPDLYTPTAALLGAAPVYPVLEAVPGTPHTMHGVELCGLMFGLRLFRHRVFRSRLLLLQPDHPPHRARRVGREGYVTMCGHGRGVTSSGLRGDALHSSPAAWAAASGIDWMSRDGLAQAIPPSYTEFVGRQVLAALEHGTPRTS